MLADAPSLWPIKLMSSLFARPTQRHAIIPGQPCQGRLSTSSSSRCAVFETWVFILVWRPMFVERGGCPSAAARAAAESGKQSWLLAEAKVARGKNPGESAVPMGAEAAGTGRRAAVRAGQGLLAC